MSKKISKAQTLVGPRARTPVLRIPETLDRELARLCRTEDVAVAMRSLRMLQAHQGRSIDGFEKKTRRIEIGHTARRRTHGRHQEAQGRQ
jgi:hypothetical protein